MYTYKVDKSRAVSVYFNDSKIPFRYQPRYPNGTRFENAAAAKRWAELFIASIEDPNNPLAPEGRGLEGKPQPERVIE
jgi:hypothetical protein